MKKHEDDFKFFSKFPVTFSQYRCQFTERLIKFCIFKFEILVFTVTNNHLECYFTMGIDENSN